MIIHILYLRFGSQFSLVLLSYSVSAVSGLQQSDSLDPSHFTRGDRACKSRSLELQNLQFIKAGLTGQHILLKSWKRRHFGVSIKIH